MASRLSERTVILRSGGGKAAEATKNLVAKGTRQPESEILQPLRGLRMTKQVTFASMIFSPTDC
jgi:hypothetical protein